MQRLQILFVTFPVFQGDSCLFCQFIINGHLSMRKIHSQDYCSNISNIYTFMCTYAYIYIKFPLNFDCCFLFFAKHTLKKGKCNNKFIYRHSHTYVHRYSCLYKRNKKYIHVYVSNNIFKSNIFKSPKDYNCFFNTHLAKFKMLKNTYVLTYLYEF